MVDPDSSSRHGYAVEKTKNGQILWSMAMASVDHFNADQRAMRELLQAINTCRRSTIYADGWQSAGNYGNVLAIGATVRINGHLNSLIGWLHLNIWSYSYQRRTDGAYMGNYRWESSKTEYGKNIDDATHVPRIRHEEERAAMYLMEI